MQRNQLIAGLVLVILGIGLGYLLGSEKNIEQSQTMNGLSMEHSVETMSMADMMAAMSTGLSGKTGDEFDKAFIAEMIIHHEGALEMAKAALTNAQHAEIKNLANAIIVTQSKEITQMRQWEQSWYGQK